MGTAQSLTSARRNGSSCCPTSASRVLRGRRHPHAGAAWATLRPTTSSPTLPEWPRGSALFWLIAMSGLSAPMTTYQLTDMIQR